MQLGRVTSFQKILEIYAIIVHSLCTFVCISVLVFHGIATGWKVQLFFSFVISAVPLPHRLISSERTGVNTSSRFAFERKDVHDHWPIKGDSIHTHTNTRYEMHYTKCRWHLVWVLVYDSTL